MTPGDVLTRAARPPDLVLRYGPRPGQVADLRLPPSPAEPAARRRPADPAAPRRPGEPASPGGAGARWPLVIFWHGGFWRPAYDRSHTGPLAEAMAAAGFAVCAPEYRRTGQDGGGWPGTFDDVALACDQLPGLVAAVSDAVSADRPVLAGHSAGGHLALWAVSRPRLPAGSPWRAEFVPARAVVSLAGVCDLAACYRQGLGGGAAAELMGGGPADHPGRYQSADPAALLPAGVPVRLVHGSADDRVPAQMSLDYASRARAAGDQPDCTVLPGAGHFDVIDPLSPAWPQVLAAFRAAA